MSFRSFRLSLCWFVRDLDENFLATVDRYLETRIESEAWTISYGGKLT